MLPIADGSDYGGSLRNPANFNNVTALRPTVGLVPMHPSRRGWWPPLLAAALLVLAVPGLVLAHAELETATPADKSTVTEPVPKSRASTARR